ncbi:MAG: hypothetical protein JSV04_01245 [Candidatus Heimdallarchaeota archaeon]|nr:MAG: hypothetical protein JSV04_01245 [Candidatus Heimdallarchaeota archaeon]
MEDGETEIQNDLTESMTTKVFISERSIQILAILGIISSLAGFFILFSILIASIPNNTLLFPHGFIIGLLLLLGGLILVSSLIILNHEPRRLKSPPSIKQ